MGRQTNPVCYPDRHPVQITDEEQKPPTPERLTRLAYNNRHVGGIKGSK